MTEIQIQKIIENQKKFFATGKTLDIKYRKNALQKLKSAIEKPLFSKSSLIASVSYWFTLQPSVQNPTLYIQIAP